MSDQLLLSCSSCPAIGSWIVPRPEMLEMVHEIAQHAGWRLEPCRCPECARQAAAEAEPRRPSKPLPTPKLRHTPELVARLQAMRVRGLTWRAIGLAISREVGFPVTGLACQQHDFRARQRAA